MNRATFAALATTALIAACAPQTPVKPDVKLYAMQCGAIHDSNAQSFADDGAYDGQERDLVDPCYLIRHPSGDLLWDSGLPDGLADSPNGFDYETMHMTMPVKVVDQLAQLQLTPADIEFISFSHSHTDHVGNANLFSDSVWIADPEEREYMFREEARADAQSFSFYNELEHAQVRLIEGDADYDVFGDGSVKIIQAPGHTPGHTVLLVDLPNAGPVLLTGDLWHMAESREARRVPRFNVNREQTLASMDKVEALAASTHARVVRQHVPEDLAALPKFPEALN